MTNGNSQGLFIVVAIVIFGIFVALSYTVFGDTLSPGIQGMFSDATEQTMRKTMVRPNLLELENLRSHTNYHTEVAIVGNSFSVELIESAPRYIAIRDRMGNSKFLNGNIYTISGYAFINGEPVQYNDWIHDRGVTNYQESITFYVDNETGYFESTMLWQSETHRSYFLHTRIGSAQVGDIYTFTDVKVEEGNFATRR